MFLAKVCQQIPRQDFSILTAFPMPSLYRYTAIQVCYLLDSHFPGVCPSVCLTRHNHSSPISPNGIVPPIQSKRDTANPRAKFIASWLQEGCVLLRIVSSYNIGRRYPRVFSLNKLRQSSRLCDTASDSAHSQRSSQRTTLHSR